MAAQVCFAAAPRREAAALARKAHKAEKKGRNAEAYVLFSEAAALQPSNAKYRAGMIALQSRAAMEKSSAPLPPSVNAAANSLAPDPTPDVGIDPDQVFTSITAREFARSRQMQSPAVLQPDPGRLDFNLNADPRSLFESIAHAFHITTVYDGDYPQAGSRIHFEVTQADYREALRALEAATSSFVVPLTSKLIMVAKDTPQKRNDLEQAVTLTIPVPQAVSPQELTELVAAVRQVTGVEKIAWDTAQNQLVLRDRVSRAIPALLLLDQLVAYRSDIAIDLEFLEVSESDLLNYGFNPTNTFSLSYLGSVLHSQPSIASGVTNLLTFGGGKTLFGISVAQVQAMFNGSWSDARSLFHTTVRSADGQPATFHVGEKYPIITSGYYGSTAATGTTYSPPPSYTFEDLGIVVKVTPHVHGEGEMTLAVETTYEVLAGQAVNNIPVIGSRKLTTQVRLRNNEWAIIAGMITDGKSKSTASFWGLGHLPWIGNLFKQVSTDTEKSHVLIAIKPQLLSLPQDQIVSKALHVGSEIRPFTPL